MTYTFHSTSFCRASRSKVLPAFLLKFMGGILISELIELFQTGLPFLCGYKTRQISRRINSMKISRGRRTYAIASKRCCTWTARPCTLEAVIEEAIRSVDCFLLSFRIYHATRKYYLVSLLQDFEARKICDEFVERRQVQRPESSVQNKAKLLTRSLAIQPC